MSTPYLPAIALQVIPRARSRYLYQPKEYKLVCLRECRTELDNQLIDTPAAAAAYWAEHIKTALYFNPDCECFAVLYLNTRRRIKAHNIIATGTLDTLLVHPREVFKVACVLSASAVILMHNHPSDDTTPSEADIKVTRDLVRAGQLMKIEVLDHVIIGSHQTSGFRSLRELGYFCV